MRVAAMVQPAGSSPRVLSIQSHVVSGYVGNKAATFPLQLLGFEVDAVNSVQFSNHTGYPSFKGSIMTAEQLLELVDGLEANGLLGQYSHLLTGYIGSEALLQAVVQVATRLAAHNPDLIYVCDPVMGDHGRLYVSPQIPGAFRGVILPIASVVTPNQFEAEQLAGFSIATEAEALAACAAIHAKGPHTVVITSLEMAGWEEHVTIYASTTLPQRDRVAKRLRLRVPRVQAYFTGTGDLFTALLLAWLHRHPGDLKTALEAAVGGLQAVLADTVAHAGEAAAMSAERTAAVCARRELRLIQNVEGLRAPAMNFRAGVLS